MALFLAVSDCLTLYLAQVDVLNCGQKKSKTAGSKQNRDTTILLTVTNNLRGMQGCREGTKIEVVLVKLKR